MKKFKIYRKDILKFDPIVIEAEDEDDARDKAEELTPPDYGSSDLQTEHYIEEIED
jgi:hypothetical protein